MSKEDEELDLLQRIKECDGYEIEIDSEDLDYGAAIRLRDKGLIRISSPRGPGRKWVRLSEVVKS